jgi:hypothetical protein
VCAYQAQGDLPVNFPRSTSACNREIMGINLSHW